MNTPRMTPHALQRCVEMGVTTKRAKRVVRHRTITYPGGVADGSLICQSTDPDLAVVWDPVSNIILTVLPKTERAYVRTATGWEESSDY